MALNRQTVIDDIRSTDPELFEDWSDHAIYSYARQNIPSLSQFDKTPGESAYEAFGAGEAPNFMERASIQFESQIQETKTGLYGLLPWTETDAYENQRIYNQQLYQQKVANNQSLQALTAWKEDEPGWTNLHTFERSLSEAIPSLAISMVSTAVGVGLAGATGGGSLAITAASLVPMMAMETGAQYNEAMATLVDGVGLEPEEAEGYAAFTSIAYGFISSLLERVGAKHYLKIAGIGKEASENLLRRTIAERIVDTGLHSNKIVRAGIRGAAGIAKTLEGALMEGSTETMQAYLQNTINRGLELNLGKDELSVQAALKQSFKETWDNPAVWEEGFAGATTGILGLPFGVATPTQASKKTSREIADVIRESESLDTPISEADPSSAPPSAGGSLTSRYIAALTDTENVGALTDLIGEIESSESLSLEAKKIQEIENTEEVSVSIGKKLLQFTKDNVGRIQEIENSPNKEYLINEMFKEILKTPNGEKINKDLTAENKLKIIKDFTLTGKIVKEEVSPTSGAKVLTTLEYDPDKIIQDIPALAFVQEAPEQGTAPEIDPSKLETEDERKAREKYIKDNSASVNAGEKILKSIQNSGTDKSKGDKVKALTINQIHQVAETIGIEVPLDTDGKKSTSKEDIKALKIKIYENVTKKPVTLKSKEQIAKEKVDEYLAPMERVQFPPAKSINDAVAIVDDVEVKLTKVQKKKLLSIKKLKNSAVLSDQGQAEVQLLELGRSLIEKHGKKDSEVSPTSPVTPQAPKVTKIISGGQIGADQFGLEVGQELGIETGGTAPPFFETAEGYFKQKLESFGLVEGEPDPKKYPKRTERNVLDSDGTVLFGNETSPGSRLTKRLAKKHGKPYIANPTAKELSKWQSENNIETLNVAGNRTVSESIKDVMREGLRKSVQVAPTSPFTQEDKKKLKDVFGDDDISETPTPQAESGSIPIAPPELAEGIEFPTDTAPTDTPVASTPQVDEKQEADENLAVNKLLDVLRKNKKEEKTPAQIKREKLKNKGKGDIETEYQDKDSSTLPYLKDEPEFVERLIARLQKHFPNIDTATFEGLIEDEGISAVGMAIEGMIAWSTTDGRLDTIPHEYAHIYIKMFKDQAIVKKGIKEFETEDGNGEENLVLAIGKYYVDRMKNEPKKLRLRFGKWLKQFVARMKRMFGFEPSQKQEIMEFIAEELYQGRWLAVTPDSVTPFKDYMTNEVETDNEAALREATEAEMNEESTGNLNKTNAMSSVDAYGAFYHKIFGINLSKEKDFPKIKNLEKENDNFEDYLDSLYSVLEKIVQTRKYEDDKYFKSKESLTSDELMKLKREWVKGRTRKTRYNIKNKDIGPESRLYFRIVKNRNEKTGEKKPSELKMEVADELDRVQNSLFPRHLSGNKIEQDFEEGRNNIRLGILPIKQIMNYVFNKGNSFYKTSADKIDLESLKEIQFNNENRYKWGFLDAIDQIKKIANRDKANGVPLEDIKAKVIESLKTLNPQLTTINATKFGDNSAIIGSIIQDDNPHQITLESFKNRLDEELKNGNINKSHYDLMMEESNYLDLDIDPDDFLSFTLSEYIDNWIQENPDGKINDLMVVLKDGIDSITYKNSLAAQLQQLNFWQGIRTPDYFMYEKSAADSMIRLSIDMAEGGSPVGLRDLKMMILPAGATVTGQIPQRDSSGNVMTDNNDNIIFVQSDDISYDLFDGASINGTQWLKELGENIGYNKFQQIKTFIRDRSVNKDGSVDYLGMKHMQFAGFKGMIVKDKDGNIIAKMFQNPKTKLTYWATIDSDGSILEKFDQVSSTNEAKMTYGKYASLKQKKKAFPNDKSKHAEGHGIIHSIKSSSIIINQVQEKSKLSGSFPVALGDLLLSVSKDNGDIPVEIQNVLSRIRSRYLEVSNHYADQINNFYKNPESLYKFVKKAKADGELISELEQWIDLIGEDGIGLQHPAVMTHLLPSINSKIIREGLNKGRAFEGTSSQLYIKPSFSGTDSKTNNQHVLIGNVILSADNKVAFKYVLKQWLESSDVNREILKKLNLKKGEDRHTLIKNYLNPFLEKNSTYVLMHRNPISKVTNPITRKVQALEEGHGESMLLTNDDVKKLFDGDWDGDKGNFEFLSNEFANDLLAWQKYSNENGLNRTVSLPVFGGRIDSEASKENSTALSAVEDTKTKDESSDSLKEIARNASNSGTTAVTMNARTILAQLFSKKLKIEMKIQTGNKSIDGIVAIANPNSQVILDYIQIDKDMMSKTEIDILKENGDTIVNAKGQAINFEDIGKSEEPLYLKTTRSHEMAILFQMAVDGSKFTHLADILQKSDGSGIMDFMLSRMFVKQSSDGRALKSSFTSEELALLKQVYIAQNYSSQRQGKTRTRISADFNINLAFSSELNKMINGDEEISDEALRSASPKGLRDDSSYSQIFTKKMKENMGKGYKGVSDFILTLENNISPTESLLIGLNKRIDSDYLDSFANPSSRKLSHIRAVTDIMNSSSVLKFMDEMLTDDSKQETYDNAENFLYEEKIYIESGSGKLPDAFQSNKEVKEASYSFIEVWNKLLESTKDREQIQADKNLMFAEFIDRFRPKYESLTKAEKQWVTIRFITGNFIGSEIYLQKLLPKPFLSNSIMQTYLKSYESQLRENYLGKDDLTVPTEKVQRERQNKEGGFNNTKNKVIARMEQNRVENNQETLEERSKCNA